MQVWHLRRYGWALSNLYLTQGAMAMLITSTRPCRSRCSSHMSSSALVLPDSYYSSLFLPGIQFHSGPHPTPPPSVLLLIMQLLYTPDSLLLIGPTIFWLSLSFLSTIPVFSTLPATGTIVDNQLSRPAWLPQSSHDFLFWWDSHLYHIVHVKRK